ncbi:MAG: hypothetical protein NXH75_05460 [Halobacteriovoraceae bacterium]|nr:hypothetical protein [Halobacteriovoraceae bacterium]
MSEIDYKSLRNAYRENLRKGSFPFPSYAEALFTQVLVSRRPLQNAWDTPPRKPSGPVMTNVGPQVADQGTELSQSISEKKDLLRSLGRFVEDSPSTTKEGESRVIFSGGEVIAKNGNQDLTLVEADLAGGVSPEWVESLESSAKVIFVGEKPKDFDSENPTADLLSKMIQAMKLGEGEFARAFLDKDPEKAKLQWEELLKSLSSFNSIVIVTLGAMATNTVLSKKERLSRIHGKEFSIVLERSFGGLELKAFPVFHPDILQINPNMKRSAWMDLQKVMEVL